MASNASNDHNLTFGAVKQDSPKLLYERFVAYREGVRLLCVEVARKKAVHGGSISTFNPLFPTFR